MRTGTECCALRDADWTSCDFNLPRAHAVVVSEIATAYSAGCGFRNPEVVRTPTTSRERQTARQGCVTSTSRSRDIAPATLRRKSSLGLIAAAVRALPSRCPSAPTPG